MLKYAWLIPVLPLGGSLILALLGGRLGRRRVGLMACGSVGLSFLVAVGALLDLVRLPPEARLLQTPLFTWIRVGDLQANMALLFDPLSALMSLVVSGVAFLIHVYSMGYMAHDSGYRRYFAYLNLFVASMLLLVLGNNFLVLYLGWELVGLCSYLLIGFWFERPEAADAGKKAFIVTRIGDLGFALAVLLIFVTFGSLDYGQVFQAAPQVLAAGGGVATAITLLLFMGAVGKSAQIPLHVWLPDAMEGPTPVSALIHAATMVTAGVYMVARTHVLFQLAPVSSLVVASIGALTAFYAATIATTQNDIKRVLAYSTISQLGYMFLAVGVGVYAAGIFHLTTHAFFKALLFLGAGSVMHALGGETDMRKMGGLHRPLRLTALVFMAGWLALSGIPPTSGFFSKDEILAATYQSGHILLWLLGLITVALTAFYMSRQVFLVFFGRPRFEEASHEGSSHGGVHESPASMTLPMVLLAILALVAGLAGPAVHDFLASVFGEVASESNAAGLGEGTLMLLSVGAGVLGLATAWLTYIKGSIDAKRMAERLGPLYHLLYHKYYVDEAYDVLVVRPALALASFLTKVIDIAVIDGLVSGIAAVFRRGGEALRRIQSGFLRNYLLLFLLGAVAILAYMAWRIEIEWLSRNFPYLQQ